MDQRQDQPANNDRQVIILEPGIPETNALLRRRREQGMEMPRRMRRPNDANNQNNRVNAYAEEIIRYIPQDYPRDVDQMDVDPVDDQELDPMEVDNQELNDLQELLPHVVLDTHRTAILNRINTLNNNPQPVRPGYPAERVRQLLDRLQRQ